MRHILFICSQNCLRSPTAEKVFSGREGFEVSSAGTSDDAECPVSSDLIDWADEIYVMENYHRNKLNDRFGKQLQQKKLVVLGIPDNYEYMDPALVELLKHKVEPFLV
jgi:predicted protein tyrosine phosphatase